MLTKARECEEGSTESKMNHRMLVIYKLLVLLSCTMLCSSFLFIPQLRQSVSTSFSFARRFTASNEEHNTEGWSSKDSFTLLEKCVLLIGNVTTGYGRGSKQLGVPTANLPYFDKQLTEYEVPRGMSFLSPTNSSIVPFRLTLSITSCVRIHYWKQCY